MLRVAHIINDLSVGGAQTMLLKLLTQMDREAFVQCVYSLISPAGAIATEIGRLDIEVRALGLERGVPNGLRVGRLARWLRDGRPHLVQTWMYHSDLFGGIAARLACIRAPLVWNIRNNTLDPSTRQRTVRVVGACARLSSRLPDAIVCCSRAAADTHAALGYDRRKFLIIPNGFDLAAFRPNPAARIRIRQELGIAADALVIGLVARFDPQKGHSTFIAAAGRLHAAMPDVRFVLCGDRIAQTNPELVEWIEAAGLTAVCHLLGERHDVPDVMAALDVACSSSNGEAFPNAVGEAMACGVPCVVTDVGESAHIVGDTGRVVPPRDPEALAHAWMQLLMARGREREELGRRARRRVARHFSMRSVARAYERAYHDLVAIRMRASIPDAPPRVVPRNVSGVGPAVDHR